MKVTSAEFVKGVIGTTDILYDGVPQIAFIGRSNVGKSSVLSALVNSKALVKIGKKPGKTTELNFFRINNKVYFVDLPGYGYARLENKDKIKKLILWYIMYSEVKPRKVVLILDIKAGFTDFDKEMVRVLREHGHDYVIVANKIDKLNQKELNAQINAIKISSGEENIMLCSAEKRDGISQLRTLLLPERS